MNGVRVRCPAKINLALEVLGKRPDGYHELRTVFQAVGLFDDLTVTPEDQDTLTVAGLPGAPSDARNLCLQALDLFRNEFARDLRVAVELHKHSPTQAGLGGGSSDAAGMLVALWRLQGRASGDAGVGATEDDDLTPLLGLAAQLGSDVAFFLRGGAMIGSGRGEALEPLAPLSGGMIVLAKAAGGIDTSRAYGLITPHERTDGSFTAAVAACLEAGCALPEVARKLYNVFSEPIQGLHHEIAAVRQRLLTLNAQAALLCGSGAAVFGLFSDAGQARAAAAALVRDGLWAVAVQPLAHGVQVIEF